MSPIKKQVVLLELIIVIKVGRTPLHLCSIIYQQYRHLCYTHIGHKHQQLQHNYFFFNLFIKSCSRDCGACLTIQSQRQVC